MGLIVWKIKYVPKRRESAFDDVIRARLFCETFRWMNGLKVDGCFEVDRGQELKLEWIEDDEGKWEKNCDSKI